MTSAQTTANSTATSHNDVTVRRHDMIAGGRRIAYLDAGEGQTPLLLIHGLAGSSKWWSENIPALAATRRTIAIDLPGFGESEGARNYDPTEVVSVIDEFCEQLGLETIDVVGHSLGTLLAIEFAFRHPHRLRRLVLTGGPITSVIGLTRSPIRTLRRRPKVANFLIEVATTGIPLPERLRRFIARHPILRMLTLTPYVFNARRLEPRFAEMMIAGTGSPGMYPTLARGFRYEAEQAMSGLRCPTLVIGGANDKIAPIEDLEEFSEREIVKKFVVLDSTGHCAMFEKPDEFNREVLEFLA